MANNKFSVIYPDIGAGGGNSNFDGWEGEVETYADLPDPANHLGEQWLVQKATGTWTLFNRKKAGLYEARSDAEGNPNWFYLGVNVHKISDEEKTHPCDVNEIRRYTPKDLCDIISNIAREDKIIMYFHTDSISPYNLLWLRQLIFPNKDLVRIYINDILFDDWEFGIQLANPASYTQHISFSNGYPSGTIKIVYKEPIKFGGMYNIRLDRYEGNTRVKVRNAMIPITMWDNGKKNMYLENAVMNNDDPTDWTVTYKQFDGTGIKQLNKKFFNTISVGGFVFGQSFPEDLVLEMWGYDKVTNFNNSGNTGGRSRSRRSTYYPLGKFTSNKISLDFSSSSPQWGRVNQLKFRFRQETSDGKVYFSEFFKETVSIKHFPLFTTNATLSERTYKGIYISTKLV